jgi:hypothetical protein
MVGTHNKENVMEDHGDMPIEDFTHGLYKNVIHIRNALWLIAALELILLMTGK